MRKLFFGLFLGAGVLFLAGCIAGGGEPYDDSESVYEPILVDIKRKLHPDVGEMVDVNFRYKNKTDENVFITTDVVKFDGEDMSVGVLAFFNDLEANSEGVTTASFQEIKEKGWTLEPLTKSLEMELELVNDDAETIVAYPLAVSF